MQIKKINNNKLKVIINSHDLQEKNIDIDSFLANSIESQDLFFEILDLAEEQYDFNIENHKAIVEAISLDNNVFILTITKLKNEFSSIHTNSSHIYCFHSIDDFFYVNSYLKKHSAWWNTAYLYQWNDQFYFIIKDTNPQIESMICEYAEPMRHSYLEDILIEHGKRVY